MTAPHLVQYQGSKRKLAPEIVSYFPHSVERLIEPFCGTCAVSIYAAMTNRATTFLLNDLNRPLAEMMRLCIEDPAGLAQAYQSLWQGQFETGQNPADWFSLQRECFNRDQRPEQLLFLLARVVKGAIRYNQAGEMNQSCDHRRLGTRPTRVARNAAAISHLLQGRTEVCSEDYRTVLQRAIPGDLIYMDPPYQGTSSGSNGRYLCGVDFEELVEVLRDLNRRKIDFLLSYDGKTGKTAYGRAFPDDLGLVKTELEAGRSAQATLQGRVEQTVESLYLSPGLAQKGILPHKNPKEERPAFRAEA